MLNPQANLMSASPYSAYSTTFTSSYTPVTSQSSYSLGGALPASYAYANTPYNYAAATSGYGNMERLTTLTQQQGTPSTTGLIGISLKYTHFFRFSFSKYLYNSFNEMLTSVQELRPCPLQQIQ
jgi:hypothetical protein